MGLLNVAYASIDSVVANTNRLVINPLILFLFGLAVVYFLYGLVEFIANQDNEEKKTAGKSHMIYGVIGMAIMMGAFAIMGLILKTFNIQGINPNSGQVKDSVILNDYHPTYPP